MSALQESPGEVGFSATWVTDDDELKEVRNNVRAWRLKGRQGIVANCLLSRTDIDLSLEPGYVLKVFVKWEGKVMYPAASWRSYITMHRSYNTGNGNESEKSSSLKRMPGLLWQ